MTVTSDLMHNKEWLSSFAESLSHKSAWEDGVSRVISAGVNVLSAYHFFDRGLADFLALKSLTHGTSPLSYLKILFSGANPKMGGTGSAAVIPQIGFVPRCQNQFHVMPELTLRRLVSNPMYSDPITSSLITRLCSVFATARMLCMYRKGVFKHIIAFPLAMIIGGFTPDLKFRFRSEQEYLNRFEPDPDFSGALKTSHRMSPLRLNVLGSLVQGIGPEMFERMAKNPLKVLRGMVYLAFAAHIIKNNAIGLLLQMRLDNLNKPNFVVNTIAKLFLASKWQHIIHIL